MEEHKNRIQQLKLLKLLKWLKLRTVGPDCKLAYILGKTVQDMILDSYFPQIASSQVTSF